MKSVSVLQVGRDINGTGGGNVILEVTERLVSQGYNVKILTDVTIDGKYDSILTPLGNKLYEWTTKNKFSRTLRHFLQMVIFMFFGTIIALKYKKKGYIVLNHNMEIFGGDILVFHNVFIAEWLNDNRKIYRKSYRFINPVFTLRVIRELINIRLKSVQSLVAVSPITLEEVRRIAPDNIRKIVVNNGVNLEKFKLVNLQEKITLKKQMNFNKDDKILLFVGHEFDRKGLYYILQALALLPKNIKLVVIGGKGSNKEKYLNFCKDFKIEDRVFFFGTIYDTLNYYQMADIFILPSSYETWALVGLESLACGTPILMTNTGGIKEYLLDGYNGYFIEQIPEDIAEKVELILNDSEKYISMHNNSRKTALKFGWDIAANKYLEEILYIIGELND